MRIKEARELVVAGCVDEVVLIPRDGSYVMCVRLLESAEEGAILITTARGAQKSYKTAEAAFRDAALIGCDYVLFAVHCHEKFVPLSSLDGDLWMVTYN